MNTKRGLRWPRPASHVMCECDILADILEQLSFTSPFPTLLCSSPFFLLCFLAATWHNDFLSNLHLTHFGQSRWGVSSRLVSPANLRLAKGLHKMQIPFAFKPCVKLRTRLPKLIKVPASCPLPARLPAPPLAFPACLLRRVTASKNVQ